MKREDIQSIFPLSGVQQAILIHGLQGGGLDSGMIQVRFRIDGTVDDPTMADAWQDVIDRHDGLRATIQIPKTQKPMVVVAKSAFIEVTYHDLRNETDAKQPNKVAEMVAADTRRALPLNAAPASRLSVLRMGDCHREYIWTAQKIFLDGYSAILVLQDVMERYRARREGRKDRLSPPPRLQSFYSYLNEQDIDDATRFWGEYFSGYNVRRPLTFHRQADGKSGEIVLDLKQGLWTKLESAAECLAVTPSSIVSAAWALFLSSAGAGEDVSFALSLSGRPFDLPAHDLIVGPFATTAPRRVQCREKDSFALVAREFHRAGFRSQRHEMLDPHLMFGGTEATRHVPMPDTLVTIETLPESDISIETDGGVHLRGFSSDVSSSFPLTMVVLPGEAAKIKFSTNELEDHDLANRILPEFPELLAKIVENPQVNVSEVQARFQHMLPRANHSKVRYKPVARPAETPMELAVSEIWKDVLGIEDVDMNRDFVSHGGRSFAAMRVLTRIEETFGKRIPMTDFILAQTVPALAELIAREVCKGPEWQTLVPFRTKGSKRPILFVHLGQHPVSFLRPFVDRLGDDQPFFAVQPVGVTGDAKPLTRFEELASLHVDEYLSVAPVGPVDVVGNCGGARLGVEVARQLEARGCDVVNFLAIDTRPPQSKSALGGSSGGAQKVARRKARMAPTRIARALSRRIRWGGLMGWSAVSNNEELRRLVKSELTERACYVADMAYRAERFPKRVVVIKTNEVSKLDDAWSKVSTQVETLDLDIGHFTLFFEPDVDILSREVQRVLSAPAQLIDTRSRDHVS